MTCARSWEIRAIDEGRLAPSDEAAFERHARACAVCLRDLTALQDLRSLPGSSPVPVPVPSRFGSSALACFVMRCRRHPRAPFVLRWRRSVFPRPLQPRCSASCTHAPPYRRTRSRLS